MIGPEGLAGAGAGAGAYEHVLHELWARRDRPNLERTRALDMPRAQLEPPSAPGSGGATRAFDLARMHALMEALGNCHRTLHCLHIAGSKGKGSIASMAAYALRGCGYTVGVYTSPHLLDVRERICLLRDGMDVGQDGSEEAAWIPPHAFVEHGRRVLEASSRVPASLGVASSFELLTALAFVYFAEQAVDVAVIEVGMGGEVDATNVIMPRACGLGAIQLEHTSVLGNELGSIARHKAGIMKPGVPAFSVPQDTRVLEVFDRVSAERGAPLRVLGREVYFSHMHGKSPELGPCQRVSVLLPGRTYEHVPVPLAGEHQAANAAVALALVHALTDHGFSLPEGKIVEGLLATPRCGRLEEVHDGPRVLIDGAHTPESIAALIRTIALHHRPDSLVVVFGCNDDKNARGMLEAIATGADKVFLTKASNQDRAVEPRELLRKHNEVGNCMAMASPTVKDAINAAASGASAGDVILVTGSFAVAGEAKRLFLEKRRARQGGQSVAEAKPTPGQTQGQDVKR